MNTATADRQPKDSQTAGFLREWFGNALLFPVLNILLEALVSDPLYYLLSPAAVSLLGASVLQAWALSRWQGQENPRRLLGNLIGPAVFTAVGLALQGKDFLAAPNHVAYWFFGLLLGIIQSMRIANRDWLRWLQAGLEAALRLLMLVLVYYILSIRLNPVEPPTIALFLRAPERLYVLLASLWLYLNARLPGFYAPQAVTEVAGHTQAEAPGLEAYAAWLFGRDAHGQVILHPEGQAARREVRVILAMDMRGLLPWSEARQPEETASLLNRYYQTAELTLNQNQVAKFRLRAGQVLAFFERVDDGLEAALKLRLQINALLHRHGLGVGIGLHSGPIVEAWLGGKDVKVLDEVGAAINIARHIEQSAGLGELLVSEDVRIALGATFRAGPKRAVSIPGSDEAVVVYPLE